MGENISENYRIVVELVTRRVHKCNWISARHTADLLQFLSVSLKLLLVSSAEFFPPRGIMGKPFSQFCAGRDLLSPTIYSGRFFAEPTRPQTVHQYADAILQRGLLISSLDLDVEYQIIPPLVCKHSAVTENLT